MPRVTSAAAARIQSGENPNAKIEPSSTTFPALLRTRSFFGEGSTSSATSSFGRSTPPTSSTEIRSRFFAVASYSRERRTSRGSASSAVSWIAPPAAAPNARTIRSGSETRNFVARRTR